jgi:hypothetical protein
MARLSKPLARLATSVVLQRHKVEAKCEAHQLRRALERLVERGVSESELQLVLQHDHWENRLALRIANVGVSESSGSMNPFRLGGNP